MVQNTYEVTHVAGYEGGVVDSSLHNIGTKIVEGGTILEGRAVVRGVGDNGAKTPTATGQEFVGVSVATTAGQADVNDAFGYDLNDAMNVLDLGKIYGFCEDGCSAGDAVFFIHTGVNVGRFRTDANTDKADAIANATFETTVTAGKIAVIKLR